MVYNYAAPWVLEEAESSPSFAERSGEVALASFVSRKSVSTAQDHSLVLRLPSTTTP